MMYYDGDVVMITMKTESDQYIELWILCTSSRLAPHKIHVEKKRMK